MIALWHLIWHGHFPVWESYAYDFLTYRWRCRRCRFDR